MKNKVIYYDKPNRRLHIDWTAVFNWRIWQYVKWVFGVVVIYSIILVLLG